MYGSVNIAGKTLPFIILIAMKILMLFVNADEISVTITRHAKDRNTIFLPNLNIKK